MLEERELTLWRQRAQLNLKNAQLDRGPNPLLLRYPNMKYYRASTNQCTPVNFDDFHVKSSL